MPGITNPAEEYFKDGVWGYVTTAWKKLVATAGGALHIQFAGQEADVEVKQTTPADLTPGVCGWDGSAWHKLPLVWGFYDTYSEVESASNVAAGDVTMNFSPVPAGEIWVVQHFTLRPSQVNASRITLRAVVGGLVIILKNTVTPAVHQALSVHYDVVLAENDRLQAFAAGASLNDDFYAYACGYKMKIAE